MASLRAKEAFLKWQSGQAVSLGTSTKSSELSEFPLVITGVCL